MQQQVALLLGAVRTEGTVELRLLATLVVAMPPQRGVLRVGLAAGVTRVNGVHGVLGMLLGMLLGPPCQGRPGRRVRARWNTTRTS